MADVRPEEVGNETPTVAVRVYRHGELVTTELCESEDDAAAIVASWEETEGVECEIEAVAVGRHDESAFEVGPPDSSDAYPRSADGQDPA